MSSNQRHDGSKEETFGKVFQPGKSQPSYISHQQTMGPKKVQTC